jgi:hypothetical protein
VRKQNLLPRRKRYVAREGQWTFFNNGAIRGFQHSELTVVRTRPRESFALDRVGVLRLSKPLLLILAAAIGVALILLLLGCASIKPLKGGSASNTFARPGHTNSASLSQPENPKQRSHQTTETRESIEYVLPAGTAFAVGPTPTLAGVPQHPPSPRTAPPSSALAPPPAESLLLGASDSPAAARAVIPAPMPVRVITTDRAETTLGGAQADTARELGAKLANMQPVMWAGIAMVTIVAGAFAYFGWWTKAALAFGVGVAMIILAQEVPDHGLLIAGGGLGLFAVLALLVLYSYFKGRLDQNGDGIPDFLQNLPKEPPKA